MRLKLGLYDTRGSSNTFSAVKTRLHFETKHSHKFTYRSGLFYHCYQHTILPKSVNEHMHNCCNIQFVTLIRNKLTNTGYNKIEKIKPYQILSFFQCALSPFNSDGSPYIVTKH